MSRRKLSVCSQKETKKDKSQENDSDEIYIKKKVKIEREKIKLTIKIPFADIISSDDESSESSQILTGIRTKFINDVPNLDSPILIKKQENKEDSQLF